MNILVTGGAGYIGSHIVKQLLENEKYNITILDNLSTGFQKTVDTLISLNPNRVKFIHEDLANYDKIKEIFNNNSFDALIHLAASLIVSESVKNPQKYFFNNTVNTTNLVRECDKHKVDIIFSSTAAVYGEPNSKDMENGLSESCDKSPINPYGYSKMLSEEIIESRASYNKNFKYILIRYFNVSGADKDGIIGQSTKDATQLIKVTAECAVGKRDTMYIFGDDYNTFDGTCIRDFIDVDDLANAHIKALEYLKENDSDIFNCGYGNGFSVKEVIEAMKEVSKVDFKVKISPRREGDPSKVISNNKKIVSKMGWKPKYNDLKLICKYAYEWEKKISTTN